MRAWILGAIAVASVGLAGVALAQANVVLERRMGMRQMGAHMEAIGGIVQSRGDQRQILGRVDQMTAFYQSLPNLVPAASLSPPIPAGRGEGQTRALALIDANRADFGQRTQAMIAALGALKTAAEAGNVTPDVLRSTGAGCSACHQTYWPR